MSSTSQLRTYARFQFWNEATFSTLLENGAGSTEREYHDHDSRRSGKDARTFDCVGDRRDVMLVSLASTLTHTAPGMLVADQRAVVSNHQASMN